MDIVFYTITDDRRKLTKTIGDGITLSGHIANDVSIVSPRIIVGYNANIAHCNYLYIPAFDRYYFINNITLSNKTMIIDAHCDVLMSFRADILSSRATITRTSTGNSYIPDPLVYQTKSIKRQAQQIGTPFIKSEKFVIQIGG